MPAANLVIISGVSGSGKSTALNAFEDLGFFCIDNLPAQLLPDLVDFLLKIPGDPGQVGGIERAFAENHSDFALLMDCRDPGSFDRISTEVAKLRAAGVAVTLLYFDSQDDVLLRRYRETRRPHPLLVAGSKKTMLEVLGQERELLADFREAASRVIDTSSCSPHDVRRMIEDFLGYNRQLEVTVVSFGFKYGIPQDVDLVVDVRFLPNPHFVPGLREFTGQDAPVLEYVLSKSETSDFLKRYAELLRFLIPQYREEGKRYLTIGVGCTGGRHRSVAIAGELGKLLEESDGVSVAVVHRDIELASQA